MEAWRQGAASVFGSGGALVKETGRRWRWDQALSPNAQH